MIPGRKSKVSFHRDRGLGSEVTMRLIFHEILPVSVLFIIIFLVPMLFIGQKQERHLTIPATVRIASFFEAAFGILIIAYSIYAIVQGRFAPESWILPEYLFIIGLSISMFWLIMASQLSQGKKSARKMCLVLSILRVPCIIGIVFSAISIYLLYFTQQSRDYFNQSITELGNMGRL